MGKRKRRDQPSPGDYLRDTFAYTDAEGQQRMGRHTPICDFCCGDPDEYPVRWSYPVAPVPVELGGPITRSDDDWAACADCHAIIEQLPQSRMQLVARIILVQTTRFRPGMRVSKRWIAEISTALFDHVERFERARTGPAEPEESFYPPADLRPDDG